MLHNMKEKLPPGERPPIGVVGGVTQEKKEEYVKIIADLFGSQHLSDLSEKDRQQFERFELPKEPVEQEAIRICNEILNELFERYGLTPFDLPEQNVHIINEAAYRMKYPKESAGKTVVDSQYILMPDSLRKFPPIFSSLLFHEAIHMAEYFAVEAQPLS